MRALHKVLEWGKALLAATATGVAVELSTTTDELRKAVIAGVLAGLVTWLVPNARPLPELRTQDKLR